MSTGATRWLAAVAGEVAALLALHAAVADLL
jgi:hypothetical protein